MESLFENNPQAESLAGEVLNLSKNTLLFNLRFLDRALCRFSDIPDSSVESAATDGRNIYYNCMHLLLTYRKQKETAARDYLHMVLHCVMRHLFVGNKIDKNLWNVACDIAVEAAINDLNLSCVSCPRQTRQQKALAELKKELRLITAEKVYRHYSTMGLTPEQLKDIRQDFISDDHSMWYAPEDEVPCPEKSSETSGENAGNTQGGDRRPDTEILDSKTMADSRSQETETPENNNQAKANSDISPAELEKLWKDISRSIQTDLETFSRQWGTSSKNLTQSLRECNREKYDYADFLRQFSVLGEQIQVNDDEFDYIFYTYGLRLYKNMPLIESLEYKEVRRVREFIIAIDTSGSVKGETVQKFITKTCNILTQTESFFTNFNKHIIQYDYGIKEDKKISSAEDFENYMSTMELKGFGGTDFPYPQHIISSQHKC